MTRKSHPILPLIAGAASLALLTGARAEEGCPEGSVPFGKVLRVLTGKHHEHPTWRGPDESGSTAVVLFEAVDQSTWSIVVVQPSGCSRLVASGTDGERFPAPLPGGPA